MISELAATKATETVLKHAYLTCNFIPLVMVTEDPAYRYLLTTFTIDHVAAQTFTMYPFYRHFVCGLEKHLQVIRSSGQTNAKMPKVVASANHTANIGVVSQKPFSNGRVILRKMVTVTGKAALEKAYTN